MAGLSNLTTNEHSIATTSGDGIQPVILAGKLTFEAWIKPTSIDVSQAIAALGTDGWQVLLMCGGPGWDAVETTSMVRLASGWIVNANQHPPRRLVFRK